MEDPMIICNRFDRGAILTALAIFVIGCDAGSPSKTADEFAADSALAADLALANRDTLLVDSIGAYREADAAERDSNGTALVSPRDTTVGRDGVPKPTKAAAIIAATTAPVVAPTPVITAPASPPPAAPATKTATPPAPAPRLTGTRACSSATAENQSECIRVSIASVDARLNRIYRALITEMRRQESVAPGANDPPSVQKLRISQRTWLVYRDSECRKRGRGKEGALWARPRARCLGEFSARRANELADNFSRLTAH
jgi:uncharacterized protein YecT (DUF1311 family)